ncbi:flagellar type III secretion system pore protein FliP [Lachnospiraceae bacterium MD1]|jgi:flagellar biosynthetic protein FliP|uniref:Flagellar biosynthetic protein FliP n=1 Tax=Variimorphobacter saccharofermentans TaxID=2755051 RepID=A0A839JYK9_9FIRM|nr:flagellar type III secretion system pore protein FliP [Variimorphobacter saccharofermentans]MBB2182753.1 flagellar type III secretion system pore protein FliP [Variimorphobacter saccharofermentans]
MNTLVRKRLCRKPAVIVILLAICIATFLNGRYANAATAKDTVKTAEGENNLSGTLGPLEFTLNTDEDEESLASTLQILLVLTVISLAPSILIMMTSFTRIIIVMHFVRSALGTQTTPPNQILIGLSLLLTFFIMSPVLTQINNTAIKPLSAGEISQDEAMDAAIAPLRTFMLEQADTKDLKLFLDIAGITEVNEEKDIPTSVIIPSFIISELRYAFIIGFLIYIPFIIIDMVVASTLMSMGMMMLPPTMISMPFKILLFILADGWNLIIGELVKTFY